jgi:hypothetical protein
VDGSAPDAPGVFWVPATAVGDGDEPGGVDGDRVATGVALAAVDDVGAPDCVDEGGAEGEDADGGVVPAGGALWVTVADGLAELEEGLGLA